jgi:peroxiredoxin Q/BCP
MAVDVGQPAPDFSLPSNSGERVSLSEYKGQKHVVLSFHVFDFTGG